MNILHKATKDISRGSLLAILVLGAVLTFVGAEMAKAASPVGLGTADSFAVLAGSFITASTPSVVSGDVGLSPAAGTLYTGLTTGMVTGTIYAVDATGPAGGAGNNPGLLTTAKANLDTAYAAAAGQTPSVTVLASSIDSFSGTGGTLTPGVYTSASTMGITGTLTLDGGGDPNATFIFQSGSSLTTASASQVVLTNGTQACNVFWQVGSSATLGTGTLFKGSILAFSSITDSGSSVIEGRLLARGAAVTINDTRITTPTCVTPSTAVAFPGAGAGADYWGTLPLINVVKVPSPLSLPTGAGPVTYTYTVTNIGKVPLATVWVKDNKCAAVQYVSGDSNSDAKLDLAETWTYQCTKTVSQTETNTATAHGYSNSVDVYDTANATVVVGTSVVPPLIHLVKVPSVSSLPALGGHVTYFYSVTNPGVAPLSNVSITDNKCTGLPGRVVGHPGDLNKNNLLDPGETFHFTCESNLTETTTNLGTAEGHANGLTAIDYSSATVVVAPPGLPNAGLPPQEGASSNAVLAALMFALATLSLGVIAKKRSL